MRLRGARIWSLALASAAALSVAACSGSAPQPAPSTSAAASGTAACESEAITTAVKADFDANYPGSTFLSLDGFTCEDGWAMAEAQFEASGSTFPTVVILRADSGAWAPITIEEVCKSSQAESGVPSAIYTAACGDS